jgi:hypothetical protein
VLARHHAERISQLNVSGLINMLLRGAGSRLDASSAAAAVGQRAVRA